MIDKAKDILLIIGAAGVAILAYILSEKDKKIGELYYQAKSEAYKVEIDELETKHVEKNESASTASANYLALKRKYEESSKRSKL
jgi:hypothetical protein